MRGSPMCRTLVVGAAFSVAAAATIAVPGASAATVPQWRIVVSRNVGGADRSVLTDVACLRADDCIAVGWGDTGGSATSTRTLVERWNGNVWTTVASPRPTNGGGLDGVSCTSDAFCLAVGNGGGSGNSPFAERWNGTRWTVVASPRPRGVEVAFLNRVSCTSPTKCMVVGFTYRQTNGFYETFAERWDGTKLSIVPTPDAAAGGLWYGVSCTQSTSCVAVGVRNPTPTSRYPTAATWNGTRWSTVAVPNPPGGKRGFLFGLSCASATACIATGAWANSNDQFAPTFTLVERWDGKRWSYVASPKPDAGRATLNDVSCSSVTTCVAVGDFMSVQNHTQTDWGFAEPWNGASWSVVRTPNPSGSYYSPLTAVSCTDPAHCVAVGANFTGNHQGRTLAEVFE